MLEVYGRGYVIEHCMSSFYKYTEEHTFRIYVTDVLRYISRNKDLPRYFDFMQPSEVVSKSVSDIKEHIRGKFE